MERSRISLLLVIACLCSASAKSFGSACKEAERDALLKLKHNFIDPHNLLGSWVGGDCCSWRGVGCDNDTGRVIKLDLRGNRSEVYSFAHYFEVSDQPFYLEAKEINPALLEMKNLTYLDLSGISFSGSSIPEFIGSMGQLQYLNLSYADFGGRVPYSLGNLTKLVVLDLSRGPYYFRSASLETNTLNWAFKLTNLEHLDLSGIELSHALDSLCTLYNLPSLSVLNLKGCGIGNSHLVFENTTTVSSSPLQHLNLGDNLFNGLVPTFIQNLSSIRSLDLSFSGFNETGKHKLEWASKLENVQYLDLSGMDLSQTRDSLYILLNLPSLLGLNLDDCGLGNSHLVFKNFTIVSSSPLQHLNLAGNLFSGPVPTFIQNLSSIRSLDLSFSGFNETGKNNLEWASKLKNLEYLDLSWIDLSQAHESLYVLLNLPSLLGLNLDDCGLGNSHLVFKNFTIVSSSPLQHLNLEGNLFSGPVPTFIQNLSSIRSLDLSFSGFNETGKNNLEWASKLKNLEYLDLSWIDLSQAHESLYVLLNLPSLSLLSLYYCGLGNSHLVFKNHTIVSSSTLQYLYLSDNLFSGPIPNFIQNLTLVSSLHLSDNHFRSSIPSWLADKRYLTFLNLNNNLFDRVDGGIMNIIGNLCSLRYLDLSNNQLQEKVLESHVNFSRCSRYHLEYMDMNNNNLSGQLPIIESLFSLDLSHNNFEIIPASFGELSSLSIVDLSHNNLSTVVRQANLASLSSLTDLDISSNSLRIDLPPDWLPPFQLSSLSILPCKLNSPFPMWLLSQEMLSELDLSDTGIHGPLPNNIGNAMPSLSVLRLANNSINGSIPRSLCNLAGLGLLDLQYNTLSGEIPNCWLNSQIQGMELSSNRLFGHIPSSLTNSSTLQLLSMNNNLLQGEIPLSLRNCVQLMVLDVGKNNLHGEIPSWYGAEFPSLQILILRENRFSGIIPPQLCLLQTLQIIDLASNNLVGNIPPCFGHFGGMSSVQQPSDLEGGSTLAPAEAPTMNPDEWSAVEVIKGAEREYTTVLHLLVNMDLSCNNLVGVIPAEITSLARLCGLNLSHNHFIGGIPKEIGKMRSLESLDFSFNNLSGEIPESISSINSLSALNLSFNNLRGQIPTGSQLQTLLDPSIYMGNPGLCGDPLPRKCFSYTISQPPSSTVVEDEDEEKKHEKMWLYLVIMSGFATGFWGVIGSLVFKRRWRHVFFRFAEDLANWLYIRVAMLFARFRGGK